MEKKGPRPTNAEDIGCVEARVGVGVGVGVVFLAGPSSVPLSGENVSRRSLERSVPPPYVAMTPRRRGVGDEPDEAARGEHAHSHCRHVRFEVLQGAHLGRDHATQRLRSVFTHLLVSAGS
jgi:hypothetical protein